MTGVFFWYWQPLHLRSARAFVEERRLISAVER